MGRSLVSKICVPRITSSFPPQKRGGELFSGGIGGKDTVKLNQKSGKSIRKQRMWSMYTLLWGAAGIRISEAYRGWCTDKSATIRGWNAASPPLEAMEIKFWLSKRPLQKAGWCTKIFFKRHFRSQILGGTLSDPGVLALLSMRPVCHLLQLLKLLWLKKKPPIRNFSSSFRSPWDQCRLRISNLPKRKAEAKSSHCRILFNLVPVIAAVNWTSFNTCWCFWPWQRQTHDLKFCLEARNRSVVI